LPDDSKRTFWYYSVFVDDPFYTLPGSIKTPGFEFIGSFAELMDLSDLT